MNSFARKLLDSARLDGPGPRAAIVALALLGCAAPVAAPEVGTVQQSDVCEQFCNMNSDGGVQCWNNCSPPPPPMPEQVRTIAPICPSGIFIHCTAAHGECPAGTGCDAACEVCR